MTRSKATTQKPIEEILGNTISRKFIRTIMCPWHGEFCNSIGEQTFCPERVEKAKIAWHKKILKEHRTVQR